MEVFFQQLMNALQWGSFYALIAIGYSMVYGVLMLFNFAHGDVFMVGAYIGFFVASGLLALNLGAAVGLPTGVELALVLILTLIAAMLLNSIVGMAVERIGYRLAGSTARFSGDHWFNDRYYFRDRKPGHFRSATKVFPRTDPDIHNPYFRRECHQQENIDRFGIYATCACLASIRSTLEVGHGHARYGV